MNEKIDGFKCRTCGFVAFGEDSSTAKYKECLGCGNLMGDKLAVKQTASSTGFNSRVLCNDETCIGVIGTDGRCKVCGKPHSSHEHNDASEKENFTKLTVSPSTSSLLESCNNCKHQFSTRTSICPKCNHERTSECFVCKKQIAKSSTSCPDCGDPAPFEQNTEKSKITFTKKNDTDDGDFNQKKYPTGTEPENTRSPNCLSTKTITEKNKQFDQPMPHDPKSKQMKISWGMALSVWWSAAWRGIPYGLVGGFVLGAIGGAIAVMMNSPDKATIYGAAGGYFAAILASMLALKQALSKHLTSLTARRSA